MGKAKVSKKGQSSADSQTEDTAENRAGELRKKANDKFKDRLFEEALALYVEASDLRPGDAALWLNRSIAGRQLERWADAEQDAERAIELESENVKAHYSRALCLQQLGQTQKALLSCRAGLKAQPDNAALLQLQDTVKREFVELLQASKSKQVDSAAKSVASSKTVQAAGVAQCPVTDMAGKDLKKLKEMAMASMYEWKGPNPCQQERQAWIKIITDEFRKKYVELREEKAKLASRGSALKVDQYAKEQQMGLQLKGGHQPMPRPENVNLPENYKTPLGVISLGDLKKFGSDNADRRYLISVYGNIFDVSDRPDKYGPDGPYTTLVGADITWGLFAGVDSAEYVNRCYDLFKAKDMGKDKLAGVCSWLAWYWSEYDDPVGRLEPYEHEADLPVPPLEEVDGSCSVM